MTGPAALACPRCGNPIPAHGVVARHVRAHPECSLRDVEPGVLLGIKTPEGRDIS